MFIFYARSPQTLTLPLQSATFPCRRPPHRSHLHLTVAFTTVLRHLVAFVFLLVFIAISFNLHLRLPPSSSSTTIFIIVTHRLRLHRRRRRILCCPPDRQIQTMSSLSLLGHLCRRRQFTCRSSEGSTSSSLRTSFVLNATGSELDDAAKTLSAGSPTEI